MSSCTMLWIKLEMNHSHTFHYRPIPFTTGGGGYDATDGICHKRLYHLTIATISKYKLILCNPIIPIKHDSAIYWGKEQLGINGIGIKAPSRIYLCSTLSEVNSSIVNWVFTASNICVYKTLLSLPLGWLVLLRWQSSLVDQSLMHPWERVQLPLQQ